jgi:integrase
MRLSKKFPIILHGRSGNAAGLRSTRGVGICASVSNCCATASKPPHIFWPQEAISERKSTSIFSVSSLPSLTRGQVATLHAKMFAIPFAANRFVAVVSKMLNWASARGLVSQGANPATRIERYPEHRRERFLTSSELGRLGDTLREGETVGLAFEVDATKSGAKHAPKPENRRRMIDPFAIAAIRLLILTGARLREILDRQWQHVDFERGMLHLPDSKIGKKSVYLPPAALAIVESLPGVEGNSFVICGSSAKRSKKTLGCNHGRGWAARVAHP